MPSSKSNRLLVGKIAKAHGIKGWVKAHFYVENPKMLDDLPLYDKEDNETRFFKVKVKSQMKNQWLTEIEGVSDRNESETLQGIELWVDRENLPRTQKEDEFYIEDLIGIQAIDKSGNHVGVIEAVENYGAGDLLLIKPPQDNSFYIAFTKENVPEIDIDNDMVTVIIPEMI